MCIKYLIHMELIMPQSSDLIETVRKSLISRYGSVEMLNRNNQHSALLPDGRRAVIKTGNNGSIMQRTRGNEAGAEYIGVADVETVVIAIRARGETTPRIYEVPGDVYRQRMTEAHNAVQKKIEPTDLRVLRFDGKGYPEQQVAEEWANYIIDEKPTDSGPNGDASDARSNPGQVLSDAKAMVASAFGVTPEQVNITVNA